MNISSWAGCCRAPKRTKITTKNEHQFLGWMLQRQKRQKSPSFIVKAPFKSIGEHRKVRELPRKMNMEEVEEPKKYENLQTKPVLDPFKSTADTRKVRELPRKMNIEEVEEPKKYENLQTKPVLDPFKSTADTRKVRELPRKMNIEEVEEPETMKIYRQTRSRRSEPPANYENSHTKRTCRPETTKIAMKSVQHLSATSI